MLPLEDKYFGLILRGRQVATVSSLFNLHNGAESIIMDREVASEKATVDMVACKLESKELWLLEGKIIQDLLCTVSQFSLALSMYT